MNTRFDRDTAVTPIGEDRDRVDVDRGWWVVRGPNGGYVAALLLRAMEARVGHPGRAPRSLTVHYTLPPEAGPAEIETRIERSGRSLTTVTARMRQGDRRLAVAVAAFSHPREAMSLQEDVMPSAPPPEECEALAVRIPIHERFEQRQAVGALPFSDATSARVGGWIKLAEGDRPIDAPLVAALTDAWPPSLFARMRPEQAGTLSIPTVDLTVHFRASLPLPGMRADDYVLTAFRSRYVDQGFVEEDGEVWSRDGRLLAQSRQLALLL
jgi:acyl-CoA thioesterase